MNTALKKIVAIILCLQITNTAFSQFELIKKTGHNRSKSSAAISRGGKYILSIDESMKCLVWEVATGAQLNVMYDVYKAKFSADGESIYIASSDKTFRQVDLAGKTLATFSSTAYKTISGESTLFYPEDDLFVSNQDLFSVKKGFIKKMNIGRTDTRWEYSPALKLLAVAGENKIEFYTFPGGEPAGSLPVAKSDNTSGLKFSDDGSKILISDGSVLWIYSRTSGKLLRGINMSTDFKLFDPSGNYVIWANGAGGWDKLKVTKAEIASGKIIWERVLTADKKYNSSGFGFGTFGNISPDGSTLLVSVREGDEFVMNANTGNVIRTIKNFPSGSARSVMLNQDKTELALQMGHYLAYWNLNNGTLDQSVEINNSVMALDRPDQVYYDRSKRDGPFVKKDKSGKILQTYPNTHYLRSGFGGRYELLEDWVLLGPGGSDPCDRNAGAKPDRLNINDSRTNKTVFSRRCWVDAAMANTKPVVAIVELPDYDINFYDYLTGEKLSTMPKTRGFDMVFSPDDKFLVMTGNKTIRILGTENKQLITAGEKELQVAANEYTEILGFTPDSKYVVLRNAVTLTQGPGTIRFLELATGKIDRSQVLPPISSDSRTNVAFLQNGRFMVVASTMGNFEVYDRTAKKIVATLYSFTETGDWAVLTPGGLFDASNGAQNTMYYKSGANIAPLYTVFEKYYTPKLLTRLLNGERFDPVPDINKLKPIPVVTVQYMEGTRNLVVEDEADKTVTTNKTTGTVLVKAECLSDKVTEIRLYQNNKLVETTRNLTVEDDANSPRLTKSFNVTLVPGNNIFRAVALNSESSESKPATINAKLAAEKKDDNPVVKPGMKLHLVVVGINTYKNPRYNLNYAQADASSFKSAIEAGAKEIFSNTTTYYVSNDQASKEGIESALEKVKQNATAEDLLIFYYAGHGVMNDQKEFYLVPYDVTQLYGNDQSLAQKGISSTVIQQYSKDIKAQKQLFILDACQSAAAFNDAVAMRGAAEEKAIAQLARSTGTHWLTASGSDQFAAEFSQLGHGSFTYCLLQALKGDADNGDKKLTVKEIDAYLQNKVPEITQKYKGSAQYPASYGYGNDFPIVVIK